MAATLKSIAVIACALMLLGCAAPWSSEQPNATPTPAVEIAPTFATATATQVPTATPTRATSTTIVGSPTPAMPTSKPTITERRVAQCCGVFSWIDAQRLLVFDTAEQDKAGAWVVDVATGSRQFVASNFGMPSSSSLIAVSDRTAGHTEIRRIDGSIVSTINNGGVLTWIAPDEKQVAWLEEIGVEQTSSLVPRTVRLWSSGIDGSNPKSLLEFRASALQWLPDSQHVIGLGRTPDGERPGIWVVDTKTGMNGVVVERPFLQALRLSPDGSRMAYLETFSGSSSQDGVWVANTNGTDRVHLGETGSFRWAGDASHLWFLDLAPRDGGNDTLVRIDVADDAVVERVDLGARVLNDQWDVSPDGSAVAYWSEADQTVMVMALAR